MKAKNIDSTHSHDKEHQEWSRRSFLQALGIGCTGSILLAGNQLSASATSPFTMALSKSENENILVLIRLGGGNDGLNTIVPMNDYEIYANARPKLYHRENKLISLNNSFSMPDYMGPLESMWGDGMMKVVNGVGYENQNLSHFTSSDIWSTAERNGIRDKGYFGKYFNDEYQDFLLSPPKSPLAIQIGSIGSLIFSHEDEQFAFTVSNPEQLEEIAEKGVQFSLDNLNLNCKPGQQQEFLRSISNATYRYSEVISDAYKATGNTVEYQDNRIAYQLAVIARLIKGNLGTKVFMVTLNGFDTHANQSGNHARLMGDLSRAVSDFYKDIEQTGHHEKVLGMTFSEFGRRVYENGSEGTDHGTASPALFFGPGLNGNGFVGDYPSLSDLDNNDNLKNTTDFRSLYSTVLSQWLCIDEAQVDLALAGGYEKLDLGFSCKEPEVPKPEEPKPEEPKPEEPVVGAPNAFSHTPIYNVLNKPSIALNINKAMHVDVQLYNILGQRVATLKNGFMAEGSYTIDLDESLPAGEYIYRISTYKGASSKIILIR